MGAIRLAAVRSAIILTICLGMAHPSTADTVYVATPGGISKISESGQRTEIFTGGWISGLVQGPDGDLYAAHPASHSVLRFAPDNSYTVYSSELYQAGGQNLINGMAFDGDGNLFVGSGTSASSGPSPWITKFAPGGAAEIFVQNNPYIQEPTTLAFDAAGTLWVGQDGFNGLVGPGKIATVAANATVSLHQYPSFIVTSQNPLMGFSFPTADALAFDSLGNLYVADRIGHIGIVKVTPENAITQFSGTFVDNGLAPFIPNLAVGSGDSIYVPLGFEFGIRRYASDGSYTNIPWTSQDMITHLVVVVPEPTSILLWLVASAGLLFTVRSRFATRI